MAKKDKKEISSSKVFVAVKYIAFILFVALSSFISVNLFLHTASDPFDQLVMLTFAVTLELLKVYLLIKANTLLHLELKYEAWLNYGIYIGSILVSIIASFAFTLNVLDRSYEQAQSSPTAIVLQQKIESISTYEADVLSYKERIATLQTQQKSLPQGYTSSFNKLSDQIVSYETKITEKQDAISKYNDEVGTLKLQQIKEKETTKSTSNVFQLMANTLKNTIFSFITENTLRLFLLTLISVLIELGIIITSPSIKIDREHLIHFLGEDFTPEKISKIRRKLYGDEEEVLAAPKKRVAKSTPKKEKISEVLEEPLQIEETEPILESEPISEEKEPEIVVENHPTSTMKARPKVEKKRYRAGIMTTSQVKSLEKFISSLFLLGKDNNLASKDQAQSASGVSETYATAFISWLLSIKGGSDLPLIQKMESDNVLYYKANYTKEYIISYMTEELGEKND